MRELGLANCANNGNICEIHFCDNLDEIDAIKLLRQNDGNFSINSDTYYYLFYP